MNLYELIYFEEDSTNFYLSLLETVFTVVLKEGDGIDKEIIEVIEKEFYDIRKEKWKMCANDAANEMKSAYGKNGCYIGDIKTADHLVKKFKIEEFDSPYKDSNVAAIGFSPKNQKWYGWSHRAICGFGVGDKIFEEDFGDDRTSFTKHGRENIKNLSDAKLAASNFAKYVS